MTATTESKSDAKPKASGARAENAKPAAKPKAAKPAPKAKASKSADSHALWVKAGLGAAAIGSAAIAAAVLYTRKPKEEPKPKMPEHTAD